jgi:hypothetical protein
MSEITEIDEKPAVEAEIVVEEPKKAAIPADEGIEGLKRQLEAEKARREAAERQAREAASAVHKAKAEVDDTNLQLLTNAIETVKSHSAQLKAAIVAAVQRGDHERAEDLRIEQAANAAKLLQLENGRQAMAERPKAAPPASDPVEALASQLTPRSAAWVRAHPECATDPRMYRKMVRAHEDAIDDGLSADTDEYFASVERRLGIAKRAEPEIEDEDGTELAAKPVSRRSSPAAAPVSRSAPSSDGSKPRVIRLSAEEREMARLNKMTDQEYWEQKQRIARDSRYN